VVVVGEEEEEEEEEERTSNPRTRVFEEKVSAEFQHVLFFELGPLNSLQDSSCGCQQQNCRLSSS
jgi:hypothetical protein